MLYDVKANTNRYSIAENHSKSVLTNIACKKGMFCDGLILLAKQSGIGITGLVFEKDKIQDLTDSTRVLLCDADLTSDIVESEQAISDFWPADRIVIIGETEKICRLVAILPLEAVAGWVSTESKFSEVVKTIIDVSHDHPRVDPRIVRTLEASRKNCSQLTSRQLQILRMVALGGSSKSIATNLSLSQSTVENHRARIFQKLGVRSAAEMVSVAKQNDLI